jgi:hypothetical protein
MATDEDAAREPVWIVNDMGELGVKVGERFFFLYKGGNIEYGKSTSNVRNGITLHDDGTPMKYRIVGKREFGETCHPLKFTRQNRSAPYPYTDELVYTPGLSLGKPEDGAWRELPAALWTQFYMQGGRERLIDDPMDKDAKKELAERIKRLPVTTFPADAVGESAGAYVRLSDIERVLR